MSELDSARRVVLLARPGPARDRMREAVAQAGAALALEADPTVADPGEVSAAHPDVALIVLDAATDEALDRFDALLSDASVEVLFEEAEVVVGREGWDAARWVRHLSAKLHRSGDVLPPGAETTPASPASSPVAPRATPAATAVAPPPLPEVAPAAAAVEPPPLPEVAPAAAATEPPPLPEAPSTREPPPLPPREAASEWTLAAAPDLQVPTPALAEESSTELLMPELDSVDTGPSDVAYDLPPLDLPPLDTPATSVGPGFQSTFDVHGDLSGLESSEISLAPLQLDEEFLSTSDDTLAPLAGLELPGDFTGIEAPPIAEPPPLTPPRFELSLVDDDAPKIEQDGTQAPAGANGFQSGLADLHSRIASMELVVDQPASQVRGAVLVLAGIGGPDAVRQLLGALPNNFPRAVLVQQRLDGGHYDKLVAQMQRATQLLVELATPGRAVQASSVYILSPSIGVEAGAEGLVFTDSPGDLLDALPAGDSAVLMLSGSDPNQVDAVMRLSGGGALVAAQALDGCYDVAAPAALASRGGTAAKPQDLARQLAERWAA